MHLVNGLQVILCHAKHPCVVKPVIFVSSSFDAQISPHFGGRGIHVERVATHFQCRLAAREETRGTVLLCYAQNVHMCIRMYIMYVCM